MSVRYRDVSTCLVSPRGVPDDASQLLYIKRIFDLVPDALMLLDQAENIAACNRTALELLGYSERELLGKHVDFVWRSTQREVHTTLLPAGVKQPHSGVAFKKNGKSFSAGLSLMVDTAAIGPFTSAMLQALPTDADTGQQIRQLQADLAHMARVTELGEMAATLIHELTQPLAAIANYSQGCARVVEAGGDTTPQVKEVLSEITRHALRAGDIIKRVRDFIGRTAGEKRAERIHLLIDEAMAITLLGTGYSNLRIEYHLDASHDVILADRIQIEQVLMNLVRNAIEAMEGVEDPFLRISTRNRTGRLVVVEVSDTGAGIEWGKELFRPFVSNKPHGIGIGLAMSKRIVEAHGGTIAVRRGEIVGTVFSFELPLLESSDAK